MLAAARPHSWPKALVRLLALIKCGFPADQRRQHLLLASQLAARRPACRHCITTLSATASGGPSSPSGKQQVIVLTGPTAVGKTKASLALAEALGGEIVSADSVQVYRGLDVGSDKIMPAERRGIPHHLIDILSPHQEFSAGDFYALARAATADILQRGRVPIVVGGTGFYLRWFVYGKPQTPTSTPETAKAVEGMLAKAWGEETQRKGEALSKEEQWEVARALVASLGDAVSADKLKEVPGNWYRLKRVLQILEVAGRPLAELDLDTSAPLDHDFRCFFLNRPRIELYRRIDARCEEMVARGLLDEAAWLLAQRLAPDEKCAARAIGYRQAMAFLQRCAQEPSHISAANLVQLVHDIQRASRNLCHRQLSWARDEPIFTWLDAARDPGEITADIVAQLRTSASAGGVRSENGRLTREQQRELKAYVSRLQLFHDETVQAIVERVRSLVIGLHSRPV